MFPAANSTVRFLSPLARLTVPAVVTSSVVLIGLPDPYTVTPAFAAVACTVSVPDHPITFCDAAATVIVSFPVPARIERPAIALAMRS